MSDTVAMAAMGGLEFPDPGNPSLRVFHLDLVPLDVPSPLAPGSFGDTEALLPTVITTAAARRCAGTFIQKPARVSQNIRDHVEQVTGRTVMARAMGSLTNAYVDDRADGSWLRVDGVLWPNEDPDLFAEIARANALALLGGSFEMVYQDVEVRDGVRYVNGFEGRGAAILEKDAAAYQHSTQFALASGQHDGSTRMAGAATAAMADTAVVPEPVAATTVFDGDLNKVAAAELVQRLTELATENAQFQAKLSGYYDLRWEAEEVQAICAEEGYTNVPELVRGLKTKFQALLDAAAEKIAEIEGANSTLTGQVQQQGTALAAARADAKFGEIKARYAPALHDQVRDLLMRSEQGEVLPTDDLLVLASGTDPSPAAPPAAPPNGTDHELPEGNLVLATAGGTKTKDDVIAEVSSKADELIAEGKLKPQQRSGYVSRELGKLVAVD